MSKRLLINTGSTFGLLTVIREGKLIKLPSGQVNRTIRCKCKCGKVKNVRLLHLVRGRIRSCGCLGGEKHGLSGGKLYRCWCSMKDRCYRESYIDSHRYLKRGITICDEWLYSFTSFKKWALSHGWKEGLQIDRINNNGNYKPGNCRFVTNMINGNNRENNIYILYNGEKRAIRLILLEKNKMQNFSAIYGRIKRGWDAQKAIDTPIRKGNYKRTGTSQVVG